MTQNEPMKKLVYLPLLALAIVTLCSHDMYLKLNSYFLEPYTESTLALFNGTFEKSENAIDRDRMIDVSLVQNGSVEKAPTENWFEKDSTTYLKFKTAAPGTYVIGVSTKARSIKMDAKAFNDYLKHDGITDLLAQRTTEGSLGESAYELYSKHVKTMVQVGEKRSEDWKTALEYPIEFIPLQNPYELQPGDSLRVQLLLRQEPLSQQLVYLGFKAPATTHSHGGSTHTHESEESHEHTDLKQFRTNTKGEVVLPLDKAGVWYLRTIHLVPLENSEYTHESNWATLTFATASEMNHSHEEDAHATESQEEIPSYYFILGSILVLGLLFFYFRRSSNEK